MSAKKDELAFIKWLNALEKKHPKIVKAFIGLPIPMVWHAAIKYEKRRVYLLKENVNMRRWALLHKTFKKDKKNENFN